ncbi:phorbol-12-myristate-13-acetate-induced protein 1 [Varanus komodoensis]|uniref:phorbol-12-myristate-13-acetate-induced protein 1 n=1 Tax=Varanus komodoensis TaxID=61221 RepID=UPI001CF7B81E|nr:phorbol-12-myristate-13-acetate-induced protein 1 [Varanus komodoensis]
MSPPPRPDMDPPRVRKGKTGRGAGARGSQRVASRTSRRAAPEDPAPSGSEAARECAVQLRKIGDKKNLQQRILNLISKLFCPGT